MVEKTNDEILFSEIPGKGGNLGEIVLNRPKALNALTRNMCYRLRERLQFWESDSAIKAVIIRGAGDRAFCAGGDLRPIYCNGPKQAFDSEAFFRDEYRMNTAIFHFKKPFISFLDGITMGGGAGVSLHGSHRIGTERLLFAMPETAIGFFPDVGAGYFLSRCINKMGLYLGLTGERIGVADAKELGLVNQVVASNRQSDVMEALIQSAFKPEDTKRVSEIIDEFSMVSSGDPRLPVQQINTCFSGESIEDILLRLEESNNEWSHLTIQSLLSASPTSLKVSLAYLQRSERMEFDEIMSMTFNMATQFLRAPDFYEGIRAAIIDKDHAPKWNPDKLSGVTAERVTAFFEKESFLKKPG